MCKNNICYYYLLSKTDSNTLRDAEFSCESNATSFRLPRLLSITRNCNFSVQNNQCCKEICNCNNFNSL